MGLSSIYLNNLMTLSVLRQMMALTLVFESYMPTLFTDLDQRVNLTYVERGEIGDLLRYFNDYRIHKISL